MKRILVWDVPTRLFHWLLAISFVAAWLSSDTDQWLSVHTFFGYLMLGLIGFRLIWGVTGGYYARFTSFLYSPMAGLAYLRQTLAGHAPRHVGHNPAGSQSVYLLLALGLAVCITGMLTQGGEEQQGAVAGLLSITAGRMIKEGHEIGAYLMLLLVFGHLAGVAMESWLHKENLPRSMVTGMKDAPEDAPVSRPYRLTGVLMLVAVTAFGGWWFAYALHEPVESYFGLQESEEGGPHVAFSGPKLPDNPKWREECGSCHLAFHPSLLPARSWQRTMAEQDRHFGTDLALDEATSKELLDFMLSNSAENSNREAAYKINRSIKPESAPLRITETPYWLKKHRDITDSDWRSAKVKSKANCAACHLDAEAGTFEDAAMKMPD
ncbi:MAG: cytochrome b/b6 domain-containing protein [Gallionella sp.]|nr:cytochrome b/b6 domain-containing protein [Gallionella sp.]